MFMGEVPDKQAAIESGADVVPSGQSAPVSERVASTPFNSLSTTPLLP